MGLLRRYPAALVIVGMALFFNVMHYLAEVNLHPSSGTPAYWYTTTVENLQSEFWQVGAAAFIFEHWKWANSPESNEDAPNTKAALIVPIAVVVAFIIMFNAVG